MAKYIFQRGIKYETKQKQKIKNKQNIIIQLKSVLILILNKK